jgi:hypothetical protein
MGNVSTEDLIFYLGFAAVFFAALAFALLVDLLIFGNKVKTLLKEIKEDSEDG